MKNLLTYLYEKQENQNIVHKSAKIVYEWFVENVGNFYDHSHGMDEKKLIKCELLDDKLETEFLAKFKSLFLKIVNPTVPMWYPQKYDL